ncbi:outer membrane lipid asymmetry maintenance protein MlaD [Aquella oligotrophica]|uniref:Outer membrane lipid asymmetry maintenance protein MlaD n=1 Tax=Aquella oligotrophica TaxID=2067065 RepID=A0A2I7N4C1_9NEIS|nr:outer membrane lipid asymmetry maintenance protein MlaD [Aquella oligotrophica]AUR51302.1 outer membrane lipid asymmetry maintenance protein MlaD [Aquella oligotrophica]
MKRSMIDFWVGIFVLIGIASMVFLSLKVANITSFGSTNNSSYTLYANFSNIGSLKSGAPVKISGFTVGRVTAIGLNSKTYQAQVVMSIDNNYHFSSDSSAQILTTGLLGEQYVGIQSGADDTMLKNNDTITLTSSAMVLEQLIEKFMTK